MKKILAICLICLSTHLSAAVPPFAQSVREIDAILHSEEITVLVPPTSSILQITHIPFGYLIITNMEILMVEVVYLPEECVGPRKFKLFFKKPCDLDTLCRDRD